MSKLFAILIALFGAASLFSAASLFGAALRSAKQQRCAFDRNDVGPKGADGGQWWYDVYKCPDGTERRVLVAGPRG